MRRIVILAAALLVGFACAQVPAFTQQYVQRLGGAVDALAQVVADFDASARAAELSRDAALEQMRGTAFLDARREDMRRTFQRHDRLHAMLHATRTASPLTRSLAILRRPDPELARATFGAFGPALPVDGAGLLFAAGGACLGAGCAAGLAGLFKRRARRHVA